MGDRRAGDVSGELAGGVAMKKARRTAAYAASLARAAAAAPPLKTYAVTIIREVEFHAFIRVKAGTTADAKRMADVWADDTSAWREGDISSRSYKIKEVLR